MGQAYALCAMLMMRQPFDACVAYLERPGGWGIGPELLTGAETSLLQSVSPKSLNRPGASAVYLAVDCKFRWPR